NCTQQYKHSSPTRRSSDLIIAKIIHRYKKSPVNKKRGRKSKLLDQEQDGIKKFLIACVEKAVPITQNRVCKAVNRITSGRVSIRSEEHTSELQSRENIVCR